MLDILLRKTNSILINVWRLVHHVIVVVCDKLYMKYTVIVHFQHKYTCSTHLRHREFEYRFQHCTSESRSAMNIEIDDKHFEGF